MHAARFDTWLASHSVVALAVITASLLAGCDTPPKGHDRGRVPVGTTTKGERDNPSLRSPELIAASDEIAQALAVDIRRIVDEEFKGHRVTLKLGDISSKTETIPPATLELMQSRITDMLLNSQLFRDHVKVVQRRQRMKRLNDEEIGGGPEDIIQTDSPPATSGLNPEYTVYLLGDAYGVHSGSTHMYYVAFKLNRASDGAELFSKSYEVKYDVRNHQH